ncbi:hypothetical protein XENTR_v10007038 [Xenopus tropicalis]|nr:hypothetical protein XENTR_v10007038 [Xenopus tropicalis]
MEGRIKWPLIVRRTTFIRKCKCGSLSLNAGTQEIILCFFTPLDWYRTRIYTGGFSSIYLDNVSQGPSSQ